MLSLHIICEFHPTWCNIHEEVHILWCTFCRKLIYHIYMNIRQFISIFIIWKLGHLVITLKVKHILCSYFPEIGRMWRAVLLYAELSSYMGSCGNYVLFFTQNCLCHLMFVCMSAQGMCGDGDLFGFPSFFVKLVQPLHLWFMLSFIVT